jgi:uncharacterized protein YdhG (YjbR/CyaY superfamily)
MRRVTHSSVDTHIAGFPKPVQTPRGHAALEKAAKRYAGPKGNLRFPYKEALPLAPISRIVKLKVKQDRERAALRKKKRAR